jgi:hypothetical protein
LKGFAVIHLLSTSGKTVCGLLMREAGIVSDDPRGISCPECARLVGKHVEKVVKTYPPDAVAKSFAVRNVDDEIFAAGDDGRFDADPQNN